MSKESSRYDSLESISLKCEASNCQSDVNVSVVLSKSKRNKKIKKTKEIHFGSKSQNSIYLKKRMSFDNLSFLSNKSYLTHNKNIKSISFSSPRREMKFNFYKFEEDKISIKDEFRKSIHQIQHDNDCETDEEVFTNALVHNFENLSRSLKKFEETEQRKRFISPFNLRRSKSYF